MTGTPSYNLQSASRPTFISLIEKNITGLVQEALAVQRHCKRARIHCVNPNDPDGDIVRRRLHADDVNMALKWRGSEKLYATGTTGGSVLGSEATKKVVLEDYLKSKMETTSPHEVGLTIHWLAVDGMQPEIPQNPVHLMKKRKASGDRAGEDGARADIAGSIGSSLQRQRVDDDDIDAEIANNDDDDEDGASKSGIHVNQLLPRLLSEDLQLYFSRVTTAIEQGGPTPLARRQQDAALSSVASDSGLQELVPFFVDYVCNSMYKHLGHSEHCRTLVRLTHSLLVNPNMHLELHLHQLLPVLFTCIVAKSLSSKQHENHWALRADAAKTLAKACNLFGDEYVTLKAQVLKTLCGAASPYDSAGKPQAKTTIYGGFVGIMLFGPKAIDAFLLPLVLGYWRQWEEELEKTQNLEARLELQMCQQVALDNLGVYLRNGGSTTRTLQNSWQGLEETFADRLVPMCSEPDEYAMCFI